MKDALIMIGAIIGIGIIGYFLVMLIIFLLPFLLAMAFVLGTKYLIYSTWFGKR